MKHIMLMFFIAGFALSCSGGGSEEGVLFYGELTQGEAAVHSAHSEFRGASLRHSAGENIEGVNICALGECAVTDENGEWGFVENTAFQSGEVLFHIQGHGIDDEIIIDIPEGAKDVFLHFDNRTQGVVVYQMKVNGENVENEHEQEDHHE